MMSASLAASTSWASKPSAMACLVWHVGRPFRGRPRPPRDARRGGERDMKKLIGVGVGPGGALTGQSDDLTRDRHASAQAAVAVVAYFIELLVVLIGEDLTMRLLHDLEHASIGTAASAKEEEQ